MFRIHLRTAQNLSESYQYGHPPQIGFLRSKQVLETAPPLALKCAFPQFKMSPAMTYEEFLDEVTTLLTEMYDLDDAAAIKLVVDAQDADYFVAHDDHEEMRTLERARADAKALYEQRQQKVQTQQKQQQRRAQQKK